MNSIKTVPCLPILLSLLMLFSSCQEATQKADLIITNATIWTGNDKQMYARSMAIVRDSIIAVGTHEDTEKFKGATTEVIDMNGSFITPGFIDTHVHLIDGGNSLLSVPLKDVRTPEEFTKRLADYADSMEPGTWILEGNWDHTLWGGELPEKEWIDDYTKENPVFVYRLDGHMALANSVALKFAGIDKNTPDVAGGEIVRNKKGIPTGILKDNAIKLVLNKLPPLTEAQTEQAFKAALNYLLSNGVTSIHDVDGLKSYDLLKKLSDAGTLSLRVYSARPLSQWDQVIKMDRKENKELKTGSVKGYVDGSLGSHTAAFQEDYTDRAGYKGLLINREEDLYQWVSNADKEPIHVMIHAIGDRAIHTLLDIYERIIKEHGTQDRRFRIEHAQHIAPEDIKRFADLGVIASMQPYHLVDDGRWAEALIGPERIKTTYAFKSLLDTKATIVFGSDWPVAPAAPLLGIYAAVTRRTLDDKHPDGWIPEEKISVEQALVAYTRSAAYASFEEDIKGTLEPGKLADFVVLSDDITKVDPTEINKLYVVQTYVGGKKVFDAKEKPVRDSVPQNQ